MKVTIGGVEVEGTSKEVAELIREFATKEAKPKPTASFEVGDKVANFEVGDKVVFKLFCGSENGALSENDGVLKIVYDVSEDYADRNNDPYRIKLVNYEGKTDWADPADLAMFAQKEKLMF